MEKKQKINWWWNIPIFLLIGILVPLGVRSVVTDDNRYGWGTFSKQVAFNINYYWVNENGKKQRYTPGKELSGKVRKKLKKRGSTRYSDGALKSWVRNYTEFMYLNKKKDKSMSSFRAEVTYRVNSRSTTKPGSSKADIIVIEYPEKSEEKTTIDQTVE